MQSSDVVVVGAGIVGLATAMTLQQKYADLSVVVVETENDVSQHQSGHNSGVLHSGIYYKPGSRKAINCRAGKVAMEQFCDEHQVSWDRCGKVVVATSQDEVARLDAIAVRAEANGVAFERLDQSQLRQHEPHAAGIAAIHVPGTGIVNYRDVCSLMKKLIVDRGGTVMLNFQVHAIKTHGDGLELTSSSQSTLSCNQMICCAGLQSDRVFTMAGGETDTRIVPFRGEYYELVPERESLCRHLIYPVPDPSFPFLGVHFTRMIDGGVECGPNAVLALSRAGYRWRDLNLRDAANAFGFAGFRKLAMKHWQMGLGEIHRSISKRAFVTALQKLIPEIRSQDLRPARAGVRAQAVTASGDLVDDFVIEESPHAIHVLNAPSPAATASLAIAKEIVDRFARMK